MHTPQTLLYFSSSSSSSIALGSATFIYSWQGGKVRLCTWREQAVSGTALLVYGGTPTPRRELAKHSTHPNAEKATQLFCLICCCWLILHSFMLHIQNRILIFYLCSPLCLFRLLRLNCCSVHQQTSASTQHIVRHTRHQ